MSRARLSALALPLLLLACSRRDGRVQRGDEVTIHYEMTAGALPIESTFGGEPVKIYQGASDVPPGVDAALLGMSPGEEKRLELPPDKAFGLPDPKRVEKIALADLGALAKGLKPGQKIHGVRDGSAETARVISIQDGRAVLDFNHPLAGMKVVYRVKVVSTRAR